MDTHEVRIQRVRSTLLITIDRPKARNAVNGAVAAGLAAALDELEADRTLRVGVLTGAGGTFSAGMDLKAALKGETPTIPGRGLSGVTEAELTKPLIAAVEGFALGGGFELALACDLIVATEKAKFGLPEVTRGLIAAGDGLIRLPKRIPYQLATELLMTGEQISGERAGELGLGYEEVAGWNPRVIYADITGFGDAGPDAGLPGFDLTAFWSRSGLLASTRDAGAPPTVPVWGSGDYTSATAIYASIATALYQRERTGRGANVGTSLLAVVATSSLHLPGLARAIGHPELIGDPRFAGLENFTKNSAVLAELLDSEFPKRPFAHWKDALTRERVTFSLIQTPEETAEDPQLRESEIVVPIEGVAGLDYTVNSPVTLRGVAKVPAKRGPDLGEHNEEILLGLGFGPEEIVELRTEGVIPRDAKEGGAS